MNITIKIYNSSYKTNVKIYNCFKEKVCDEIIDNKLDMFLEKGIYKIVFNSCGKILISTFYVDKNNTFIFSFDYFKNITFLLTDYYYKNLPIEYGLLTLK